MFCDLNMFMHIVWQPVKNLLFMVIVQKCSADKLMLTQVTLMAGALLQPFCERNNSSMRLT